MQRETLFLIIFNFVTTFACTYFIQSRAARRVKYANRMTAVGAKKLFDVIEAVENGGTIDEIFRAQPMLHWAYKEIKKNGTATHV